MAYNTDTGKRFKTVVSSAQVAHLWANKAQPHARTSTNNMFFDGKTIYSYGKHFPIASFTGVVYSERENTPQSDGTTLANAPVVLFNCNDYSVTTAKHKSEVRHALNNHVVKIFYVDKPDAHEYAHAHSTRVKCKAEHKHNARNYLLRISILIGKALKAKGKAYGFLESAQRLHREYSEYCKVFLKIKGRSFEAFFNEVVTKNGAMKALKIRAAELKAVTTIAGDITPLQAFEADTKDKQIKHDENTRKLRATHRERRELQEQNARLAREARKAQIPLDREAWLKGENVEYPTELRGYNYYATGTDASPGVEFRVIRGGAVTQSSLGAEVPTRAVKVLFLKLWEFIHLTPGTKEFSDCKQSIEGSGIGAFKVDELTTDGKNTFDGGFKAGCHVVKWSNVEAFAKRLGWLDADGKLNSIGINYVP